MRFVALVLILFLSGCLESTVEEGRVFTVETLDRPEDAGPMYSMKDNLSEGPVLVLFIGVGCIGCKDWTDDLRDHHTDWMAQEPPLQIVSVERYLNFETKEDVAEEFGFQVEFVTADIEETIENVNSSSSETDANLFDSDGFNKRLDKVYEKFSDNLVRKIRQASNNGKDEKAISIINQIFLDD